MLRIGCPEAPPRSPEGVHDSFGGVYAIYQNRDSYGAAEPRAC